MIDFGYNTGKNYLQWHGSQAQLVITEPELCKEILNNKGRAYPKREPPNLVKKLVGDGLVATMEAEKWAKLRKLATNAFHGEGLKVSFFKLLVFCSKEYYSNSCVNYI